MLKALKELIGRAQTTSDRAPQDDQLLPSAAAMLLLEVAWADHDMSDDEIAMVENSLHKLFELPTELTSWIVADARAKHEASVGLYDYTRTINNELSPEEKFELMVALWRLALSDNSLHSLEEHAIRRISELIYVPHAQFIRAKQQARSLSPHLPAPRAGRQDL